MDEPKLYDQWKAKQPRSCTEITGIRIVECDAVPENEIIAVSVYEDKDGNPQLSAARITNIGVTP